MHRLWVVYPNGKQYVYAPDGPPTLAWLQEQVGGYITCVKGKIGGRNVDIVINEEGHPLHLSYNPTISLLAYRPIMGTAVVFVEGKMI